MYESKTAQHHNNYFYRIFSDLSIFGEYIVEFFGSGVADPLNLDGMYISDGTHINDVLEESRADIRAMVPLKTGHGFVCFVIEAKSYYSNDLSKNGIDQVERYTHDTWDKDKKSGNKYRTPVLASILYHGDHEWDHGDNLSGAYGEINSIIRSFAMNQRIIVIDLRKMKDDEITGSINLTTPLFIMKYLKSGISVISDKLEQLWSRYTDEEINSLRFKVEHIKYIMGSNESESPEKLIKFFRGKKVRETFMTALKEWEESVKKEGWEDGRKEGWEDGRKEGWEDGRKEGWEDGRKEGWEDGERNKSIEIAKKLKLSSSMSIEDISQLTGLTTEEVKDIEI